MSVRVTVNQLQEQLPELLDRTVQSGQECIVQRDGADYAVIVSARQWQRRKSRNRRGTASTAAADEEEARVAAIGRRLDSLGEEYCLPSDKQERMEELLSRRDTTPLSADEQRELDTLVGESDEIMLRRAQALPRIL